MARGIAWPVTENGKVSTTKVGKTVWAAALVPLKSSSPEAATLSAEIMGEKNWRANYIKHIQKFVELQGRASPQEYLASSVAVLEALNNSFTFTDSEGKVVSSAVQGMATQEGEKFVTTEVKGTGIVVAGGFAVNAPAGHELTTLVGEDLKAQADAWGSYGCIEASAAEALREIAGNEAPADLVKGKVFVLLGATSALGPFNSLASLGATIACVARPGKKLDELVERARGTPATLLLPTRPNGKTGADLVGDAPELAEWLITLAPGKELVLGCYVYLDGEKHVRASVAMDLVVNAVCAKRKNTSVAQLVSPATSHAASPASVKASAGRYDSAPLWHAPFRLMGAFQPAAPPAQLGTGVHVLNGLSNVQGPNYALAKTSQQWRAAVLKSEGYKVSANHAPAARTESMVAYATIAAALEGMQSFQPLVAFDPETASSMMAAILLWDLNDASSKANPANKDAHPMDLLLENACHGGIWGCAYTMDTIGTASFLAGKMTSSYTPVDSLPPPPPKK